jgi:hypothetical protein
LDFKGLIGSQILSIILFSKKKVLEPEFVPVLGQSADCSSAQAVGHWPLMTMAWNIQYQAKTCGICDEQRTETDSKSISFTLSICSTSAPYSHSFIYH